MLFSSAPVGCCIFLQRRVMLVTVDEKITCYQFSIKKYVFRIGFIFPWWIKLPWSDREKWIYYKRFNLFQEITFESRIFCFAFAFRRDK